MVMKIYSKISYICFIYIKMISRMFFRIMFINRNCDHLVKQKCHFRRYSRFSLPPKHPNLEHKSSDLLVNHELTNEFNSFVPISVVKQYLLRRNILFHDGYTSISITCPVCGSLDSLYINKISGFFICTSCKISGNWNLLESHFSHPEKKIDLLCDELIEYGKINWIKLCDKSLHIDDKYLKLGLLKNFPLYFEDVNELNVRVDKETGDLQFPLMYSSDAVGYITLKQDMSEETFPFKNARGIVIKKSDKKSAVVVASLKDFLALLCSRLDISIICLPHGQETLPQEILPMFEKYEKLILWFNNDSVSWGNMKMLAKKLSEDRCSLVQPIESQPAPFECIMNGTNIPNIIKNAQEVSHHSIITFSQLREDVLSELYNADKVSGVKWERFPALNAILKGHRRGELTILTGPTGSGKTTFISEYSLDLVCNKVTTLWGSFEIRNQRLAKTMMTQMFSAPLDSNLDKFEEWADKFERLPLYFMTFHGQQPLETVMETVKHATYVHDVVHVIIDNVQFMLGLGTNDGYLDRFYRQDALIASFRNFATTFNCHVTLVIHPRKEKEAELLTANSIFGGAKAAQEADNILIIQNKMSHSSLRVKKYLQVAKNRFTGDLGIMPLDFDKESLSFRTKKVICQKVNDKTTEMKIQFF